MDIHVYNYARIAFTERTLIKSPVATFRGCLPHENSGKAEALLHAVLSLRNASSANVGKERR